MFVLLIIGIFDVNVLVLVFVIIALVVIIKTIKLWNRQAFKYRLAIFTVRESKTVLGLRIPNGFNRRLMIVGTL